MPGFLSAVFFLLEKFFVFVGGILGILSEFFEEVGEPGLLVIVATLGALMVGAFGTQGSRR